MGGASSATKQQQGVNLAASQQQLSFDNTLQTLFQKQFASQQNILQQLQATMKPVIANAQAGNGFSPAELAAMRTSTTDQLSTQEQNAQAALNQTLKANGDSNVPSGVTVGANEALQNQEFQANANAQNNITVQNAQQANSNLFNAANVFNGVAAQDNPLGYASSATAGTGAVAATGESQGALQNSITSANNNSFFGKLETGIATGISNIPFAIH